MYIYWSVYIYEFMRNSKRVCVYGAEVKSYYIVAIPTA